ncbi:hypothetical protein FB567DRAFT_122706 [Paraphoma chrysanthemicola]|uniref:Uncharacterized protein n=1 Tax=Paraphoma chrysanthemicola TaxID=798071 RepID=A0A8K0R1D0_9PLEO|nr:hypothetical protein FB567DRAFT_122706 [Paraphoma chrysanthemicola]
MYFTSLPAEIRNQIYVYALTSPTGSLTFDPLRGRFDVSDIGAGLLITSRSLYEETRYLPLQLNQLVIDAWGYMGLLSKLNRLEQDMGWMLRVDVR